MNFILPSLLLDPPSSLAVGVTPCRKQRGHCQQRVTGIIHLRGWRAVTGRVCHSAPTEMLEHRRWLGAATQVACQEVVPTHERLNQKDRWEFKAGQRLERWLSC